MSHKQPQQHRRQREAAITNNNSGNENQSQFPKPLIFGDPTSKKQLPPPFFLHENENNLNKLSPSSSTFSLPALPYASRRDQPKSAVHWGQLKLFLSELQLLTQILPDPLEPHWIIYVGSAPGQHLVFLDKMFGAGVHEWELVDPGRFDPILTNGSGGNGGGNNNTTMLPEQKFTLRSEFFDNSRAYELMKRRMEKAKKPALASIYDEFVSTTATSPESSAKTTSGDDVDAARKNPEQIPIRNVEAAKLPLGLGLLWREAAKPVKTLFISDVRSGQEDTTSFEEHVYENSLAQETWTDILQPTFAMLKFRLPYSFVREPADPQNPTNGKWIQRPCQFGEETLHLDGKIMLPLFARLTSTEARLIVPEGAGRKMYNHKKYEDHFFFFNSIFREYCHFAMPPDNHKTNQQQKVQEEDSTTINSNTCKRESLDHRFDCAAEAWVLYEYLTKVAPKIGNSSSSSFTDHDTSSSNHHISKLSILDLASLISKELHGTIAGAAKMNDDKLVELAVKIRNAGQIARAKSAVNRAETFRNMKIWRRSIYQVEGGATSAVWDMLIELKDEQKELK